MCKYSQITNREHMEEKKSSAYTISSIQKLCRTCTKKIILAGSSPTIAMNIFERLSEGPESPTVMKVLRTLEPQIKINFQDHLPKMECIACIKRLRKTYRFLETYKQANKKLLKLCENIDKSEASFSSDDEDEVQSINEQESTFQGDNKLNINGENDTGQKPDIERTDDINYDLDISLDDLMENSYDNKEGENDMLRDTYQETNNSNNDMNNENLLEVISTGNDPESKVIDNNENQLDVVSNKNPSNASKQAEPKQKKKHRRKTNDYKCETCGKVYPKTKYHQYRYHLLTHQVGRPFLCSECGKGFKSKPNLQDHMARHKGEKKIPCPICPKKFVCHAGLNCHIKIHNKVRSHVCETCGASFYRSTLLRHHKISHTNDKPYPCEECDQSFPDASALKCHMRKHTGEQPYSCYYCDRKFSQSGSCVTHMKIHVGVNVHQCELCPIRFPRVRDLREHIIEHKDEDEETRKRNLEARAIEINNLKTKFGLKKELKNYTKKVNSSKMPVSLDRMCRTCIFDGTLEYEPLIEREMVPLETTIIEELNISIMQLLKASIPQLKLDPNAKLPKNICLDCVGRAKEFYVFQQRCLEVENQFDDILETMIIAKSEDDNDNGNSFYYVYETELDEGHNLENAEEIGVAEEVANVVEEETSMVPAVEVVEETVVEECKEEIEEVEEEIVVEEVEGGDSPLWTIFDPDDDDRNEDDFIGSNNSKEDASETTEVVSDHEDEVYFPCTACDKKFTTEMSLKKHMRVHREKRQGNVCHICNRAFLHPYLLRHHMRGHNGEKPFLCQVCGKAFKTTSNLNQHAVRHQPEKLFACSECPKKFIARNDLISHYEKHKPQEKTFVCDVCGHGFAKEYRLKRHKIFHTNERPFACEFCDKRFFTNEKRNRHTRIHTGEKPYKCTFCDKAYRQSNELTKHLRMHLGENIYQCQLCPERFATIKTLQDHFSKHKDDDEETRARNLAAFNATEIKGIFYKKIEIDL
ncbi:uncharacterized protein [Musca autumnalis]|uniref:uncharacterized protein n=1 Tax=Musca autumnalis TaxID=221902 RepID=UPI003CF71D5F